MHAESATDRHVAREVANQRIRLHDFAQRADLGRSYLFIDGAFLRRFALDMGASFGLDNPVASIDFEGAFHGYERVFFYDAFPSKATIQSQADFDDEYEKTEALFNRIAECPNFNVRPALTRRSRKQEQKGVDIQLALECYIHGSSGTIDVAAVMTSDLDFFPLFEAMLFTKARTKLLYQLGKAPGELIRSADLSEPLTAIDFANWARLPTFVGGVSTDKWAEKDHTEVIKGTLRESNIKIVQINDSGVYHVFVDGVPLAGPGFKNVTALIGTLEKTNVAQVTIEK
jgi:uncharacterized LabA/DUF88 family protein